MIEIEDGDKKHKFVVYLESIPCRDGIHTGDLDGMLSFAEKVKIFAWHKDENGNWVRCYTPAFESIEKKQKVDDIIELLEKEKIPQSR